MQPLADQPFTAIQPDSRWKNSTHPGSAYAALLVDSRYRPPLTVNALPEKGGPVLAVAIVKACCAELPAKDAPVQRISVGDARRLQAITAEDRNLYDPANAWTDQSGFLHLRIAKTGGVGGRARK